MPERGPTSPYLALCEVCGASVFHSHKSHEPSAQHLKSRKHRAAIARRKRDRAMPERRDQVRVMVRLDFASMPRGVKTGEQSFGWRALPREAVELLSKALYEVVERFAPQGLVHEFDTELWTEAPDRGSRRRTGADQGELDFAQPRRGRADTRACTTLASLSPGTSTSPSSGRTAEASARPSRSGAGAAALSSSSRRGKHER